MRLILTILILFSFSSLCAQGLHSKNKKAVSSYQKAKELSDIGNLYQSEELLLSALKRDKSFDEAILLLHQIYLRKGLPLKSEEVFNLYGSSLEQSYTNRVLSDRANYYYELGRYDQAAGLMSKIKGEVFEVPAEIISLLRQSIQFATNELKSPLKIEFETLPKPINEFGQQYFPSITASGKLVFTVRENNGRGNENLYYSFDSINHWTKPQPISHLINTDRNEGTASISADGSTLVFTACNIPGNIGSCDLYISYYSGDSWSKPELLGGEVNSEEWDSQPALSRDGKQLYFVSRRSGGFGREDIWFSEKKSDSWTEARNLGPQINTEYDDSSPYIYIDQKTLFFASKGRVGMGGYDLFSSSRFNEDWTEPENLGFPINNSFDQIGYSISIDGWAYYSSSKQNGKIELNRFRVPREFLPKAPVDFISGLVLDANNLKPLEAVVLVLDSTDLETLPPIKTQIKTGAFFAFVKSADSKVLMKSKGYKSKEVSRSFFRDSIEKKILLEPFTIGEVITRGDINFDFNSYEIKEESFDILNDLIDLIRDNSEIVLEIGGHTDSIGEKDRNLELSLNRAKSVYRYFIENGVSKENLVFKGYGEQHPLTSGNKEEDSQRNRRIEFRIAGFLK